MGKTHLRRALAGLSIAALAIGVMAAAPAASYGKPTTPGTTQSTDPVPAGFANWPDVYAFQDRLNAAAERILAAGGAGNASIVAGPQNRALRVYWNGEVPAAVRTLARGLDVPVVFLPARFSHDELVTQARRLAANPQVAPNADGSGLAVTVAAAGQLRQSDQSALRAGTSVPLTITAGPRPQPKNRQADTPNFYGGSAYEFGIIGCSNGFPIRFANTYYMLVAGHCVFDGAKVTIPGQPSPTGTVFGTSECRDTALINYPSGSYPRIYTGPANSNTSVQVLGATSDFVGNLVATGGATSGEHVNIPVQAVDVFVRVNGASCGSGLTGPLTRAGYSTATCAVADGDSGGPVYAYSGANVLARGTITSGFNGTATCPNGGTTGSNTVFYAPMFRPAGDREVGSLDFYRAAPPPATTFNLSGRWSAGTGGAGPFISVNDTTVTVDMSAFGRPTARGSVLNDTTISVTFPDDATYTGTLQSPNVIRWSNNSSWTKVASPTIFDLNGKWTDGRGPGPFISVNGSAISVDMSANRRPTAHGSVLNSSTITMTFPDDTTYTGTLQSPNVILWSNNSFWTKL